VERESDDIDMGKLCLLVRAVSLLLVLVSSPEPVLASPSPPPARRRYGSIFSLGDSYADTGNGPVAFGWHSIANPVMRPPYGSTFFGRPTGRNCDGRLPIDFLGASLAGGSDDYICRPMYVVFDYLSI